MSFEAEKKKEKEKSAVAAFARSLAGSLARFFFLSLRSFSASTNIKTADRIRRLCVPFFLLKTTSAGAVDRKERLVRGLNVEKARSRLVMRPWKKKWKKQKIQRHPCRLRVRRTKRSLFCRHRFFFFFSFDSTPSFTARAHLVAIHPELVAHKELIVVVVDALCGVEGGLGEGRRAAARSGRRLLMFRRSSSCSSCCCCGSSSSSSGQSEHFLLAARSAKPALFLSRRRRRRRLASAVVSHHCEGFREGVLGLGERFEKRTKWKSKS